MAQRKKQWLEKLTPFQILVTYYFLTVLIAAILFSLPISRKTNAPWTFMDAIFTAASAVSVTGLTTVNIVDTFSTVGIFLLMIVIQIGGIGIMSISTFFWLLLGRRVGLKHRELIRTDQNQINLAGLVRLLKQIILIILFIECIGAIVLGTYYLNYFPTWQEAFLQGLFASISATTNAGFDITGKSLLPFANDYFVQIITMILIILGAIGFPVWIEIKKFLFDKPKHFRFSLSTKVSTATFFSLLIFGAIIIIIIEMDHFFNGQSWHQSFFYALFQSTTMRSAGLLTLDINQLSTSTILFMAFLMFIGASPSSVGGGIRTTTFAVNLLFLYNFARGRKSIKIFGREIFQEDITKSQIVLMLAMLLVGVCIFLLTLTEDASLVAIIFEVTSAFGTCGASLGITPDLTNFGKSLLILLMFIGRVGVLSFLMILHQKEQEPKIHFPRERVIIG